MTEDLAARVREAYAILDGAFTAHGNVVAMYGMFSGGHDSLCATHLAAQHSRFTGAAHVRTTIGIPQTLEYVRAVSGAARWGLHEFTAPVSYREIVLKHGFPGPGGHRFMYSRLKERAVRRLVREAKVDRKDRVALVTGVRLSESARRMGHVSPIAREGAKLWVAPILNWTDADKLEYMAIHNLPRNPVVDQLCMSGECLCGAFAKPEELAELTACYPEVAAEIRALEEEVKAAGQPHCRWGKRPGVARNRSGKMCSTCDARAGL